MLLANKGDVDQSGNVWGSETVAAVRKYAASRHPVVTDNFNLDRPVARVVDVIETEKAIFVDIETDDATAMLLGANTELYGLSTSSIDGDVIGFSIVGKLDQS